MIIKKKLLLIFLVVLFSSAFTDTKTYNFSYPKKKGTEITLISDRFKKFNKEWRGSDYYYYSEKNGFICSVLYYKLIDKEKETLVDIPKKAINGQDISPAYPFAYFKNYSNLKSMERNDIAWGKPTDDFMFRQNDVGIEGTEYWQKHMYGYAMVADDIFVNIHLSKVGCSTTDSTEMVNILNSLKLVK